MAIWKPIVSLTDHTEVFGTKVMSRFAWTFDRRSRRLRAQLSSTVPLELESVRGTGAVRAPTDAGFEIVRVLPKTPAEEAGLRAGDLIVAEDGIPVYERGCARWDTSEQRDTVTLSVQRHDQSFDVTLSRVVLVP